MCERVYVLYTLLHTNVYTYIHRYFVQLVIQTGYIKTLTVRIHYYDVVVMLFVYHEFGVYVHYTTITVCLSSITFVSL